MTNRIAVIPARGGSKRIPDKNIVDFCGKPLIAYSLEAARNTNLFDEIHVSTDSNRIANVVEQLGFPVSFFRPHELADDYTPLVSVLRWVLQEFARRGKSFESLCNLLPCAPLIEAEDIVNGYRIFDEIDGMIPVIAVAQYPVPVEWAYYLDEGNRLVERQPGMFAVRSQDIRPGYYDSSTFNIFSSSTLLDEIYQGGGTMKGMAIPTHRAIDIDEPSDLVMGEIMYLGQRAYSDRHGGKS